MTLTCYDLCYTQWRIQKSLVGDVVEAERPKTTRGWGVGSGQGVAPPQIFFSYLGPQNGQFRCIVGAGGDASPTPPESASGYTFLKL